MVPLALELVPLPEGPVSAVLIALPGVVVPLAAPPLAPGVLVALPVVAPVLAVPPVLDAVPVPEPVMPPALTPVPVPPDPDRSTVLPA